MNLIVTPLPLVNMYGGGLYANSCKNLTFGGELMIAGNELDMTHGQELQGAGEKGSGP